MFKEVLMQFELVAPPLHKENRINLLCELPNKSLKTLKLHFLRILVHRFSEIL